ncbi:uncharacterized protein LOC106763233 [Vigna radiata var. radiata]|uniref:Uncharacterized protein LOC106763233 n=1 Tax=Vigna radiata var. radiata TaxID=3916 RepID=A0A1S3UA71_VIGRR|nr:uncharacterized protein LOC106763233 [Vigna radiata var. radiata]
MEKSMRDLTYQEIGHQLVCTQLPLEQNASGVELKPGFIRLLPTFHGWEHEDPHQHIKEFILVCSSMKPSGANEELVMRKAFPLSLQDNARHWMIYQQQPFGSWQEMQLRFLNRFFPASRVSHFRRQICTIEQGQNESLADFWDRFNRLCLMCPNHQLQDSLLLTYFYEGLLQRERMLIDVAAGGSLMNKTPAEAKQLLSNMAECSYQGSLYNKAAETVPESRTESKDLRELTQVMSQLVEKVKLLNQEPLEDKRTTSGVLEWSENIENANCDAAAINWKENWSTKESQELQQIYLENEQSAGSIEDDKKSSVRVEANPPEKNGNTKYIPPHLRGNAKLGKMQPAQKKKEVQLNRTASQQSNFRQTHQPWQTQNQQQHYNQGSSSQNQGWRNWMNPRYEPHPYNQQGSQQTNGPLQSMNQYTQQYRQNQSQMQPKMDPILEATIQDLKMQIGQLAHAVNELVNQKVGGIPAQPVVNPKEPPSKT